MLLLKKISLTQFKNYAHHSFGFDHPVVAISGKNGAGKTNLLEAIYYLSLTKSYFGNGDQSQVQTGMQGFRIDGQFSLNDALHDTHIILRENGKKEIGCDGVMYEKFSDHIGKFPMVMIAPDDIELINGGSEIRRRLIDTLLCQTDSDYMQTLIRYNRILQQRNGYLKQAFALKRREDALLDTLDDQLADAGGILFEKRKNFTPAFRTDILRFYSAVSGTREAVDFRYESQLHHQPLKDLLHQSREKDYLLQRTQFGIHKDNLELLLEEQAFRNRGSQGQKKSLLFAIKLAEASSIEQHKRFSPLLLLDDVFEKLDSGRMENLLHYICNDIKAQIFLTDTHPERMQAIFSNLGKDIQNIHINN